MKPNTRVVIIMLAAVLLSGCRPIFAHTQRPTFASRPTPTRADALPEPATQIPETPTLKATSPATPSPEPSATFTSEPLSGEVFTPLNAGSAQATDLQLSSYPAGLYWPGNQSFLVNVENSFLEITLEPLMAGQTIPIQVPGTVLGIAPDASGLVYQGGDGGLFYWNRNTGSSQTIPFGSAAYFAAYSPDGLLIAIGAVDSWKVTLYDTATMQPVQSLTGFQTAAPVYSALPGPNRGVLAWYARGKLQFQEITSRALGAELGYQDFIMGLAFKPGGNKAAVIAGGLLQEVTTSVQGIAAAQDLLIAQPDTPISSVIYSPDGGLIAAGVGGNVIIWETANLKQVAKLKQGSGVVRLLSFSPDGRALVSVDDSNLLKSWRIP